MRTGIVVFAALPLLLGGCITNPATPVATTVSAAVTDSAEFTRMATSSNLLEIESSKLAMQRSKNREVRRFAGQMIRDHGKAGQEMMAVLRRAGLPAAPKELSAKHQAMLDELEASSPESFDSAYATLQASAHDEAIALFSTYAESGDNPRLTAFARKTLPTLRMHAQHVSRMGGADS